MDQREKHEHVTTAMLVKFLSMKCNSLPDL